MKLFIDIKNRRLVKSAASNVALDRLVLKRRDLIPLEYVFVENGAAVTLPVGTTVTCAIKKTFADGNFLALATGTPPELNLNTIPLEAAFLTAPAVLVVLIEIRWQTPGSTTRTAILKADLENSVILGNEGTPQAMPDGKATQAEAESAADNDKWMTPLRVSQTINKIGGGLSVFNSLATLPVPGLLNRLYVTTDTGRMWRWTGTTYDSAPGTLDAGNY